jgi:hypothetical protein
MTTQRLGNIEILGGGGCYKKQKMLILESLHNYEPLYNYIGRLKSFPKEC